MRVYLYYHDGVIIKNSIFKNFTRYITPWIKSRVLDI